MVLTDKISSESIQAMAKKRDKAKSVSIVDYLDSKGVKLEKRGDKFRALSPITEETNPSFIVYPENRFWDFSSGTGGDIIDLVCIIENIGFKESIEALLEFIESNGFHPKGYKYDTKRKERVYGNFNIRAYSTTNEKYKSNIFAYAEERGFKPNSFIPCRYKEFITFDKIDDSDPIFLDRSGVGFPHTDHFGLVCGIKIRGIDRSCDPKFNQRGKPGFYVLENIIDKDKDPTLYVVESETSASSFASYVSKNSMNAIIISCGGVNTVPNSLPFKYEYLQNRKLILDYDGDEEKWKERSYKFRHLNAIDIKIPTPKGTDLAVLSKSGEIRKYL